MSEMAGVTRAESVRPLSNATDLDARLQRAASQISTTLLGYSTTLPWARPESIVFGTVTQTAVLSELVTVTPPNATRINPDAVFLQPNHGSRTLEIVLSDACVIPITQFARATWAHAPQILLALSQVINKVTEAHNKLQDRCEIASAAVGASVAHPADPAIDSINASGAAMRQAAVDSQQRAARQVAAIVQALQENSVLIASDQHPLTEAWSSAAVEVGGRVYYEDAGGRPGTITSVGFSAEESSIRIRVRVKAENFSTSVLLTPDAFACDRKLHVPAILQGLTTALSDAREAIERLNTENQQ